jgi:uncharacterized membrane protein YphA (DoxX/SURF4 family)
VIRSFKAGTRRPCPSGRSLNQPDQRIMPATERHDMQPIASKKPSPSRRGARLMVRLALGAVLATAGLAKILYPAGFQSSVDEITWLPAVVQGLLVGLLPSIELGLGLAILAGWKIRQAAALAMLLLVGSTAFLAIRTATGSASDCGCFGGVEPAFLHPIMHGPGSILRNMVLILMAGLLITASPGNQPLSVDRLLDSFAQPSPVSERPGGP